MRTTINGLRADLKAANSEASGYIAELGEGIERERALRDHITTLEAALTVKQAALDGCDRLCTVLIRAVEHYQLSSK